MQALIISKDGWELSTEIVMDWMIHYGVEPVRINGDSFESDLQPFKVEFREDRTQSVYVNKRCLCATDIQSIWIRRWANEYVNPKIEQSSTENKLLIEILNNQKQDQVTVRDFVLQIIQSHSLKVLTKPSKTSINKLLALQVAQKVGLDIPNTIVTNDKNEAVDFFHKNYGEVVSKDISTALAGSYQGERCFMYASKVTEGIINSLPERFSASLFQSYIAKKFEIRSFFLNSKVYSMAIMSQSNKETAVDFRQYSYSKPNRTVPYQLPASIESKLCEFMNELDYQTGSFDIIKTPDNRYVFLEMNPVGQFGMISDPCNYPIESDIAKYLCENGKR